MPRTPEQYEEIRTEKKLKIMSAALELFAEEGFHATSISQIATKAKISKGLIYNYFKSKEDLLNEIIDNGFGKMINNFDFNKDNFLTDQEFIYFIKSMFDNMEEDKHFWKIYFSLMLQSNIAELINPKIEKWYSNIFAVLTDFFTRKNIKDPETEAMMFGAQLDGLGLNFMMNPIMFPKEKIIKSIVDRYITE